MWCVATGLDGGRRARTERSERLPENPSRWRIDRTRLRLHDGEHVLTGRREGDELDREPGGDLRLIGLTAGDLVLADRTDAALAAGHEHRGAGTIGRARRHQDSEQQYGEPDPPGEIEHHGQITPRRDTTQTT